MPTDAQKKAGNYPMYHIRVAGLDISIENRKGSIRSGVGRSGVPWSVKLPVHYGYFKRSVGADGDQVDVLVGPSPESTFVVIVNQFGPGGVSFDEHKVMLGFTTLSRAKFAYRSSYTGTTTPRAEFTETTLERLKEWLKSGRNWNRFILSARLPVIEFGSALRRAVSIETKSWPGMTDHTMKLGGKIIGGMTVDPTTRIPQVTTAYVQGKFQGMGLGKKLYGEVLKRTPGNTLASDDVVSHTASRVWESMKKRPGSYRVTTGTRYGSPTYSAKLTAMQSIVKRALEFRTKTQAEQDKPHSKLARIAAVVAPLAAAGLYYRYWNKHEKPMRAPMPNNIRKGFVAPAAAPSLTPHAAVAAATPAHVAAHVAAPVAAQVAAPTPTPAVVNPVVAPAGRKLVKPFGKGTAMLAAAESKTPLKETVAPGKTHVTKPAVKWTGQPNPARLVASKEAKIKAEDAAKKVAGKFVPVVSSKPKVAAPGAVKAKDLKPVKQRKDYEERDYSNEHYHSARLNLRFFNSRETDTGKWATPDGVMTAYRKARRVVPWVNRGGEVASQTADMAAGHKVERPFYKKAWFKSAVTAAAIATPFVASRKLAKYDRQANTPGMGMDSLSPLRQKALRAGRKYVPKLIGAFADKRQLVHFDMAAAVHGWDVRDPRGRSARVFSPGSKKRERREKTEMEKVSTIRTIKNVAVAAALAGTAGTLYYRNKAQKLMPAKPAVNLPSVVQFPDQKKKLLAAHYRLTHFATRTDKAPINNLIDTVKGEMPTAALDQLPGGFAIEAVNKRPKLRHLLLRGAAIAAAGGGGALLGSSYGRRKGARLGAIAGGLGAGGLAAYLT